MDHKPVTEEEMRALLPYYEIEAEYWARAKKRIVIRTLVVVVLWIIRGVVIVFFPAYYMQTVLGGNIVDLGSLDGIVLGRSILMLAIAGIYFYSLIQNRYFRTVSVSALIVGFSLLWSDLEMYVFSNLSQLTAVSLSLIGLRFMGLGLLFLNYLDVRR